MKTFTKELERLRNIQKTIEDGLRIYSDGSIREETVTLSGEEGWRIIAKPLPGLAPKISMFFEDGFLAVENIRLAIDLRDQLLTMIVEERTIKSMENVIRKRVNKETRDTNKAPPARRTRVPPHSSF